MKCGQCAVRLMHVQTQTKHMHTRHISMHVFAQFAPTQSANATQSCPFSDLSAFQHVALIRREEKGQQREEGKHTRTKA